MLAKVFLPFGFLEMPKQEKRNVLTFWIVAASLLWQFYPFGPLFPRPQGTWESAWWLFHNGLLEDIVVSGSRILQASMMAFVVGCLLGYAYNIAFFRPLVVLIALLRNIPMAALVAVMFMAHLTGERSILFTMFFMIVVYFVSGLTQLMDDISRDQIDHAITMRMSSWQILWHRVIRNKAYSTYMAFIPCVAMGWSMLTFVEGLSRTRGGLGDRMLQVDKVSSYDGILAIAIISGLFGFVLWWLLRVFGRWKFNWAIKKSV